MRRIALAMTTVFVLGVLAITMVSAQGMGGNGSGPMAQFRNEHKFTFQLMQMVRKIGEIDQNPKYALKPAQAKKILGVLKPLRSKPTLTQDQAKTAIKKVQAVLTVDQLNAMARIKERPRGFGGGPGGGQGMGRPGGGGFGGPGMGAPGGRPGGQGNRPRMDASRMKNFNPFYKNPKAPAQGFAARGAKRMDTFFADLQKKAGKGKK